jgi:RNA-directed DNA polymerase
MKTYKNLYPQIYNFSNLYQAFRAARKGKRDRVAVASFEFDLEHNLLALETELRDQTYRPGPYTNFYIYEPKRRLVSAAPFHDRVVHQ